MTETKYWYAFRIYRNSRKKFIDSLMAQSQTYYVAEQVTRSFLEDDSVVTMRKVLFPSIVFVHCTSSFVESAKKCSTFQAAPYTTPGTREPAVISDKEMETFMFVLEHGCERIDVVDEKLVKGDRVRVLEGLFKGAEGYIARIKGDRRFIVTINGVAAVATTYIPQRFLEKITEDL